MDILKKFGKTKLLFFFKIILILFFLYKIRGILSPFIFSFFIAYCFKDFVSKHEKKISRNLQALLIVSLLSILFILSLIYLLPLIFQQTMEIIKQSIKFIENFNFNESFSDFEFIFKLFNIENPDELKSRIIVWSGYSIKYIGNFTNSIISSSLQVFNIIFKIFLIPIIAYYFIVDWNKMVKYLFKTIPNCYRKNAIVLSYKIDDILHHYIIGQILVTLILSLIYSALLFVVKFDYAITVGFVAGFLTLLPYIGSVGGFLLAFSIVFFKYGIDITKIAGIGCAFGIGQFLEGNFITPNIIGKRIRVHSLWIIFAMMVGANMYGFFGIIFSMPLAAIIGVVIRYNEEYKIRQIKRNKRYGFNNR